MAFLSIFGLYFKNVVKPGLILSILCLALFASCDSLLFPMYFENTATEPIDLEVLRPADTTINKEVKKLLVFNEPGVVPKILVFEEKNRIPTKLVIDKITGIEFHSMADLLSGSPRYTIMEPVDTIKAPLGDFYNWDEIDSICSKAGVDACLILSRQDVIFGLKKLGNEYAYKFIWLTSYYEFYSPKNRIALTKEVRTGVDFQNETENNDDIYDELNENGSEALISDFARQNGEKLANWIAPVWQRDTRDYYTTGNKELESVKELIKAEKWDEVFKIWRKNIYNENIVAAKHASYNSIISYEMEGKLDSALIMARDAYKRFQSEAIVNYGLILEERIRERELVNLQLDMSEKKESNK